MQKNSPVQRSFSGRFVHQTPQPSKPAATSVPPGETGPGPSDVETLSADFSRMDLGSGSPAPTGEFPSPAMADQAIRRPPQLLSMKKPHDRDSTRAVLDVLLSEAGQIEVRETLSQATPQIKALLLEMVAKAMSSPHCTAQELSTLIQAYAPSIDLRELLSPIWEPERWPGDVVSGVDRAWAMAERLADQPQVLADLQKALPRVPGKESSAWAVLLDFAQYLIANPDERKIGDEYATMRFLREPLSSGRSTLNGRLLSDVARERRALFGELWLTMVVNGVSSHLQLHHEFLAVSIAGEAPAWSLRLQDKHEWKARLAPSLSRNLSAEQLQVLELRHWARLVVRNPRLLPGLGANPDLAKLLVEETQLWFRSLPKGIAYGHLATHLEELRRCWEQAANNGFDELKHYQAWLVSVVKAVKGIEALDPQKDAEAFARQEMRITNALHGAGWKE